MTKNKTVKIVRLILCWIARIGSIVSIGLILMFFIGEGFDPANLKLQEWIGFFFFPVGIVVGMIVAWWQEGMGGTITVGSLLAFYIVHFLFNRALPQGWAWIVFTSPGILFLASWALSRNGMHVEKL